jgi:ribosomal protein S18 acetylase RimI-like enzyme
LIIRPYEDTDQDGVIALWREAFPDAPGHNDPATDIARKLDVQRELFFVAVVEEKVIGTAMAGYDGHRGWVYYVAVSDDHRRKGVGTALMRRVEEALPMIGCRKLNLQVRAENEAVIDFYRSLGYEVEPRVSMSKRLDPPPA